MKSKFRKFLGNLFVFLCVIIGVMSLIIYKYEKTKNAILMEQVRLEKKVESEVVEKAESDDIKEKDSEEIAEKEITEKEIREEEIAKKEITEKEIVEKEILQEYKELYEQNSDLYGWITIKGENEEDPIIDYPVMYTPDDPNFYEKHNWKKETSIQGGIWIDGRCNEETENIIIYGHRMKDGSMFGSLKKYKEQDYFYEHKYIQFNNLYEKQTYEIIAVSESKVYYKEDDEEPSEGEYLFYQHVNLDSEEEFCAYISNIKENACYETGVTAEYGDQLITLCTCDYHTKNGRLLVVAKRID